MATVRALQGTTITFKAGWVISGFVILFMAVDAILRIVRMDAYVEGAVKLGYPDSQVVWIGLTLAVCTLLYALPRTAVFGAILLTAYIGGAIASQVRAEEMGPVLFAGALGVLAWAGLGLRDERVRDMLG
jgi:hypothetical protein